MAARNVALRFGISKFGSMRHDFETRSDVTYIGPRSFVAGFAVVCALFVGIAYGAARFADSRENDASLAATIARSETTFEAQTRRPEVRAMVEAQATAVPSTPNPIASPTPLKSPTPVTSPTPLKSPTPVESPTAVTSPIPLKSPTPDTSQNAVKSPTPVASPTSRSRSRASSAPLKARAPEANALSIDVPHAAPTVSPVAAEATRVARNANASATPAAQSRPSHLVDGIDRPRVGVVRASGIDRPRSERPEPTKVHAVAEFSSHRMRAPNVRQAASSELAGVAKPIPRKVTVIAPDGAMLVHPPVAGSRRAEHRTNELLVPFASAATPARSAVLDPRAENHNLLIIKAVSSTPMPSALKPTSP